MDAKDKIIEDLQQHLREELPPECIDETFDYEITNEDVQRLDLTPTAEFETYQFIELPESPVFVSEHRVDEVRSSLQRFHHRNVHGSPKCWSCQETFLQRQVSLERLTYVRLSSRTQHNGLSSRTLMKRLWWDVSFAICSHCSGSRCH